MWPNNSHTRLTALCPGLPRWAGTRKVKPIWILLKHETVSGSGISWAVCNSAPRSRQITTPAPYNSVFYRPDALPSAQPTASKHWRNNCAATIKNWQFEVCTNLLLQISRGTVTLLTYRIIFYCIKNWWFSNGPVKIPLQRSPKLSKIVKQKSRNYTFRDKNSATALCVITHYQYLAHHCYPQV